jgi:hypothetical protein
MVEDSFIKIATMNKLKIGDTTPLITIKQALDLHNTNCKCDKPYIIEKPIRRLEQNSICNKKFFSQKCWICLACKWESEIITTRTA